MKFTNNNKATKNKKTDISRIKFIIALRYELKFATSIARFLIRFASAIIVIHFGGFEGPQAGVIMIMSMMPVAVLNYIFTVQNDKDSNTVGGLVMISTTIMLVVLPFFMNNILNYY